MKKKPICTVKSAHGTDPGNSEPRWISAIATQHNTDLIVSGSHDGHVRLWKSDPKHRMLRQVAEVDLSSVVSWDSNEPGFVNSVAIHPSGKALVVGLGQEHRLGRWYRHKAARNGLLVISLNPKTQEN